MLVGTDRLNAVLQWDEQVKYRFLPSYRFSRLSAEEHKEIFARRRVAVKRYADPEEVAHGTLNFCLPASSFMTGATLPVDGGLTIKNA